MALDVIQKFYSKMYTTKAGLTRFGIVRFGSVFRSTSRTIGGLPHTANTTLVAGAVLPYGIFAHFIERSRSMMISNTKDSHRADRLAGGLTDARGASGTRDLAVDGVQSTNEATTIVEARVLELNQRRAHKDRSSGNSKGNSKHQLQLRVDSDTRAFISELMYRSEAEGVPEVVRMALREYERVWHEFDGNIVLPKDQALSNDDGASSAASNLSGASGKAISQAKPSRINIVLAKRPMNRLKRLMDLTGARSQAEVITHALCVLDVVLDQFDHAVSGSAYVSTLDELRGKSSICLDTKKRSTA